MHVNEGKTRFRVTTRPNPSSNGDAAPDGRLPLQECGDIWLHVGGGHGVTCILVSRIKDSLPESRSAAPGWQGATTEHIGDM
jgi:hypothetical protein